MDLFLKGFLLGVLASLPLGPISATVIDVAMRHKVAHALSIAVGGALVDLIYCFFASLGLFATFGRFPSLSQVFYLASGAVLIQMGVVIFTKKSNPTRRSKAGQNARTIFGGVMKGILISVANPALILSWVLLAGTFFGGLMPTDAIVASFGVFAGVCFAFYVLARLADHGRVRFGEKALWVPRIAGLMLVAYGAYLFSNSLITLIFRL
jgi:threonine/homoserine/homoserine lactone efflux protein